MIEISVPDYSISYEAYGAWCDRVGHDRWHPTYRGTYSASNKGMYLNIVRLPSELALLFKLEFGI